MSIIRVFASHDWGKDGVNHSRVARVVGELRHRNLAVWFDETHMRGNILDAMCRGIDSADVVLVFLTSNYMKKVESGNDSDNVRREFMYAANTPDKFLCVKFESSIRTPWTGPVRMFLGSQFYVDMTGMSRIDALVDAIRRKSPRMMWKTAVQRTRHVPATQLKCAPPRQGPVRGRVQKICEQTGTPTDDGLHLCKLVDRLHVSLVGTVDASTPLITKIESMEKQLGIYYSKTSSLTNQTD